MIKITSISRLMFTLLALASISVFLPAHASGQSRLESYLRKADLNSDGRLAPNEMTAPIKRYMLSKGYDVNERHRIQGLIKSAEKQPATEPSASDLKVPKFGVEATSGTGVSSFSGTTETVKYSESVTEKTRDLFKRYDGNGNGILDEGELARISWGRPRPSANDTNGDGRLTFTEVQGRYHAREVAEQRSELSVRASGRGRGETKEQESDDRRSRGRFGRGDSPSRDSGRSGSGRGVTSSPSSREKVSDIDRTKDYVDKYFSDRDEDGNGVLEGDELKKVSRVSKYDKNRDGKIEAEEMLAALAPKETTTSSSKKTSTSGRRTGTTSSRTQRNNKLDANGDGVIQMHEFSKEWTQKKLDEFLAKDKNGDGVLSPEQGER